MLVLEKIAKIVSIIKNFIHGCSKMIAEARELILKQQHDLETLQNFYDKQEESIWGDTWIPHDECW